MAGIIAGIVIALTTAIISAYINRRSKTGKINTSEAKDLWDTLRSELARLQTETMALRTEMAVAREEMAALRLETSGMRASVLETENRLALCLEHSSVLEQQLEAMPPVKSSSVRKKKTNPRLATT